MNVRIPFSLCLIFFIVSINSNAQLVLENFYSKESRTNYKKNLQIYGDSLRINIFNSEQNFMTNEGYFFIKQNDKWGLLNSNKNQLIIPYEIDSVLVSRYIPKTVYSIKRNNSWESVVFNKDYKMISIEPDYGYNKEYYKDNLEKYYNQNFEVIYNGKIGLMNKAYKIVIPIKYDFLGERYDPKNVSDVLLYVLANKNDFGFYYKNILVEPNFKFILSQGYEDGKLKSFFISEEDFFTVRKNNKIQVLDLAKNEVLPQVYDEVFFCLVYKNEFEPIFIVKNNQKSAVITRHKTIISFFYDEIIYLKGNSLETFRFIVKKDGQYGLINAANQILIPIEYQSLEETFFEHKNNHFIVKKENQFGVINIDNVIVIPIERATSAELKKRF